MKKNKPFTAPRSSTRPKKKRNLAPKHLSRSCTDDCFYSPHPTNGHAHNTNVQLLSTPQTITPISSSSSFFPPPSSFMLHIIDRPVEYHIRDTICHKPTHEKTLDGTGTYIFHHHLPGKISRDELAGPVQKEQVALIYISVE
jgi:hypothetical protein